MRYYNKRKNQYYCPIINLDKLWSLLGEEVGHDSLYPMHIVPLILRHQGWAHDGNHMGTTCVLNLEYVVWLSALFFVDHNQLNTFNCSSYHEARPCMMNFCAFILGSSLFLGYSKAHPPVFRENKGLGAGTGGGSRGSKQGRCDRCNKAWHLQGAGQGRAARPAYIGEGQVCEQACRDEDQERRRCSRARCLMKHIQEAIAC